jgi:hypothetical protein
MGHPIRRSINVKKEREKTKACTYINTNAKIHKNTQTPIAGNPDCIYEQTMSATCEPRGCQCGRCRKCVVADATHQALQFRAQYVVIRMQSAECRPSGSMHRLHQISEGQTSDHSHQTIHRSSFFGGQVRFDMKVRPGRWQFFAAVRKR